MFKFSKIMGGTAVALTLLAGATQASAALVTEWGYTIESGFSAFAPAAPDQLSAPNDTTNNGVVGSDPNAGIGGLPTTLSWGLGANGGDPSSLVVTPTVSSPPNLFTNGPAAVGATITHNNNIISEDSEALASATLASTLLLTPINPAGAPIGPIPVFFFIAFDETPNAGPCAPGTGDPDCADIFVLQNPGALSFDFVLDEFIYTVELNAAGLGPLSDGACASAGEPNGCIGFLTDEGESNDLTTSFTITARGVSEPGTLALLGLGLLGLGIARRRKAA